MPQDDGSFRITGTKIFISFGEHDMSENIDWLLANGLANPLDALAGATPYLRLFSIVTGGWVMAQQALKATALLADAAPGDKSFYEGKVLTARFFCEQLLPQATGLVPAVTATNRDLAAAVF